MYPLRLYVEAGGLMSYSADLIEIWRRAAVFVDKILKGCGFAMGRSMKRRFIGTKLTALDGAR
jgi:hypothetical protein